MWYIFCGERFLILYHLWYIVCDWVFFNLYRIWYIFCFKNWVGFWSDFHSFFSIRVGESAGPQSSKRPVFAVFNTPCPGWSVLIFRFQKWPFLQPIDLNTPILFVSIVQSVSGDKKHQPNKATPNKLQPNFENWILSVSLSQVINNRLCRVYKPNKNSWGILSDWSLRTPYRDEMGMKAPA